MTMKAIMKDKQRFKIKHRLQNIKENAKQNRGNQLQLNEYKESIDKFGTFEIGCINYKTINSQESKKFSFK